MITYRPEFQAPWLGQPHVFSLALNRLARRDTASLVDGITGGRALPPEILDRIVERTDGVPLFIEELTKSSKGVCCAKKRMDTYSPGRCRHRSSRRACRIR